MTDLVQLGFKADSRGILKAERDMNDLTAAGGRLDKQNKLTERSLGLVGSAIAALGISAGVRDLIRYADAWTNVNSQLRQVTNNESELTSVRDRLLSVTKETRMELTNTVNLYAEMQRGTSELNISSERLIGVTKTLNNLFLAGGKPISEAAGAIRQLNQGFASGVLRGDEFNSVAEGAPKVLDALSQSLGMTRGELRDFAATGGITAQIMIDALEDYRDTAQELADQTEKTFGQSLENASTNMTVFAGNSEAVSFIVGGLGDSIEELSEALVNNSPYVEAYFSRFAVWGEDIQETANIIEESFIKIVNSSAQTFPILADNSERVFDQIIDGFRNLPDNLRAAIQILTVELAHLVDLGMAYGQSFAEVLGVQFGALIDKSAIWGKQLLNNLNPFEDAVNFESDIAQIEQISSELVDSIISKAVARADVVRQARLDSIVSILNERDAAIEGYGVIVQELDKVASSSKSAANAQDMLFAAFKETSEAPAWLKNLNKESKSLAKLTDSIDNLGGSWTRTGSIIVDTFGSMADALNDYGAKMRDINKLQEKLNDERKKDGADLAKLDELQMKLNNERASAEIGNYAAISGAAQDMFSEKTAAAKIFGAINQALSVAEIALAYQKISASNAETASHVANEGTKQSANALTAITSAFGAPWPINFVAGAAMIGIMASLLGSSFGGGGGGSGGNGTGASGTAMGGGVSESLSKANESLEDIMIDQLAELRGLRGDLNTVNDRTFGLFRDLLAVDAGHSEIKNRTERELERSFSGLNMGMAGGAFTSQLGAIFDSIGESINEAMNVLSLTTNKSVNDFVFRVSGISFDELSGEEAEKRLGEVLSAQSDLLVEMMVPFVKEYQQTGEGALETLTRLAREQAVFNDALERTGMNLNDLSSVMQIDVAQSIIKIIGGAEEFSDLADEFFENFYSDAEQFQYLQKSITDVFDQLGLGISGSREEFRALVEGIDLTTQSGQELYAALLQVSPAMAEYFDTLDELANDKLSLQIELLEKQGKSQQALALSRQMELDAADESLHAIMRQIWALEDLNKAREEERQLLEDNVAFAEQELEKARKAEIDRINLTVDAAESAYDSQLEAINAQRAAYNKLIAEIEGRLSSAENALNASLNAELSKYDEMIAAANDSAQQQINAINSVSSARVKALNDELSIISSVANSLGAASKSFTATEALAAARRGDFTPATNIATGGDFSSAVEARIAAGREAFALNEIGMLADAQMSDLERTISATERSADRQINAINEATANEVAELEAQKELIENQVKAILGIDDTVLSLDEAMAQYQKAQDELQNAISQNTLDKLQAQEDIALQAFEKAKEDAQSQIDLLNNQVDELLNIDNSVASVEEAIKLLLSERQALAEFEAQAQSQQLSAQKETTDAVRSLSSSLIEMNRNREVQKIYDPVITPPIVIIPESSTSDEVVKELKMLRNDLDNANAQIGANTKKSADSLRKLEYMQQ